MGAPHPADRPPYSSVESNTEEEEHPDAAFDPRALLEHWGRPADDNTVRAWKRRLIYKKLAWRATHRLAETLKRGMDVTGAGAAIIVFSPVFVGTALAIKLEDRGPVLFTQKRVGKGGESFPMFKFRSMVPNAEDFKAKLDEMNQHDDGVTFKIKDDPRITKVGHFIRKFSVDEFPQFFNVLRGDMSLVGPRPAVPKEVEKYRSVHLRRLMVKPGITCLWQVGGRSEIDFEDQVRLDLEYIASESLLSDVVLLFKTIPAVLKGEGAY
jgi:exopolysaccharide biosynthesis polyprenyl glycosylphosphotransferase